MRIIKHGNPPVKLIELICPECGCVFECDILRDTELVQEWEHDLETGISRALPTPRHYVTCPEERCWRKFPVPVSK